MTPSGILTGNLYFVLRTVLRWLIYFYSVILTMLSYYLPTVTVTKCSTDKPWVTPSFRNLVKSRQRAFLAGDLVLYHRLRKFVLSVWLTNFGKKYFETKVEQLHLSDPHHWWTKTKRILKLPDSNTLANLDCKGSPDKLAGIVNDFLWPGSRDPLIFWGATC